jgi:hypothetical protein
MGLYKICKHKERARDRCKHAWWVSFRARVSLAKWTNREIKSKAEADKALDEPTAAIRDVRFDERGPDPPPDNSPMTFGGWPGLRQRTSSRRARAVLFVTTGKPLIERFGNRPIAEIKRADIDDFVGPETAARGQRWRRTVYPRPSTDAGALRHAQLGSRPEYSSNTIPPRHRVDPDGARGQQATPAISESEEAALLAVASATCGR